MSTKIDNKKANKLARKLTGNSLSEFAYELRWRLGPTPEEVTATFEKANLAVPRLAHDDGCDLANELRVHAWALSEMHARMGRCPCGCSSTWDKTVSGTCGAHPAVWGGCSRRSGSATSVPFVGRDTYTLEAAFESAARLGLTVDDFVEIARRLVEAKKRSWENDAAILAEILDDMGVEM